VGPNGLVILTKASSTLAARHGPGAHDTWQRQVGRTRLASPATQLTFESDYEAVLSVKGPPRPAR